MPAMPLPSRNGTRKTRGINRPSTAFGSVIDARLSELNLVKSAVFTKGQPVYMGLYNKLSRGDNSFASLSLEQLRFLCEVTKLKPDQLVERLLDAGMSAREVIPFVPVLYLSVSNWDNPAGQASLSCLGDRPYPASQFSPGIWLVRNGGQEVQRFAVSQVLQVRKAVLPPLEGEPYLLCDSSGRTHLRLYQAGKWASELPNTPALAGRGITVVGQVVGVAERS